LPADRSHTLLEQAIRDSSRPQGHRDNGGGVDPQLL